MKSNSDFNKSNFEDILCFMPIIISFILMIVIVIGLLAAIYINKNPKEEPRIIGSYFEHYKITSKGSRSFRLINQRNQIQNVSVHKHCEFNNLFYHYYNSGKSFTLTYNTYRYVDFWDSLRFYDKPEKTFDDIFCD